MFYIFQSLSEILIKIKDSNVVQENNSYPLFLKMAMMGQLNHFDFKVMMKQMSLNFVNKLLSKEYLEVFLLGLDPANLDLNSL